MSAPAAGRGPAVVAARTPAGVRRLAAGARDLDDLDARVTSCRACPRLVAWREEVARTRRRAYADEEYWGRPVPGLGDPAARLLVVGLAPAAHGGNRTGRAFTGDASGDWIVAALHRAGLANQPTSVARDDGLVLTGVRIAMPVRCAPPDNAPLPGEKETCAPWLDREVALLPGLAAVLALGGIAWQATLGLARRAGWEVPRPAPRFGHGATAVLPRPGGAPVTLVGSYHVSRQNTSTGRLTRAMLDEAVASARDVAASVDGHAPVAQRQRQAP
ncbi:uracil-DNA glycosylase [Pseudokineococcus lusitanus]|uniref:uracil-DNA glycosylase n=1 Tax=Pseudokineococcus lusitanus TaxID=763993 RepID=UPI001F542F77|nr:uracil-DNA glycosylase [Pseudokineococcus lusitanus]